MGVLRWNPFYPSLWNTANVVLVRLPQLKRSEMCLELKVSCRAQHLWGAEHSDLRQKTIALRTEQIRLRKETEEKMAETR